MQQFDARESELLGYYVYVYTDPRSEEPFYVGKGKGNRAFSHLNDGSRWEFVGRVAEEAPRGRYRWRSVAQLYRPGAANPIMYAGPSLGGLT